MKIGIDIDDTTVKTVNAMIKYADRYDAEVLGKKRVNDRIGMIENRYYLKVLYGWDDETKLDFFNRYYKNVLEECEIMEHASNLLQKLKKEGHELFFITARLENIHGCDSEVITKNMLEKNQIPYDKLIMGASDKLTFCKQYGIEIFIEDSYETCKQLEENGIKTYFMTTKMNEKIEAPEIQRVNSWYEMEEKLQEYLEENKRIG